MNTSSILDPTPLQKRTKHFLRRQRERRIYNHQVLTALRYGHRDEYNGFTCYCSRGLYIVADQHENLVTAYWLSEHANA